MDTHVVIMFELNRKGEDLDPMGQVNEVFGPFYSGETAEHFAAHKSLDIPNRQWLVIPLISPAL